MKRLSKSELIKKLLTKVYLKANDDQKTWLEATNSSWLSNPKDPVADARLLTDSIVKELPVKPKVVVDIGAGNGSIAINLALKKILQKHVIVKPQPAAGQIASFIKRSL